MRKPLCLAAALAASGILLGAIQKNASFPAPQLVDEMEKFIGCPASGELKNHKPPTGKDLELNLLKNRYGFPNRFDPRVKLPFIVFPGLDANRWSDHPDMAVKVHGYVAFMIQNFLGESCNCYKLDDAHSDTHIDLVVDPKDAKDFTKHVIIEITPRMKFLAKKRGLDWSTDALNKQFLHHWVDVEGWLLWDWSHLYEAQNTHPDDPKHKNWRASCWEVHPVTSIELSKDQTK